LAGFAVKIILKIYFAIFKLFFISKTLGFCENPIN